MSREWPLISYESYIQRLGDVIGTERPNGYGTALYLSGMSPRDFNFDGEIYSNVLSHLQMSDVPTAGWLVGFERRTRGEGIWVPFLGIVTRASPTLVTHRFRGKTMNINQPLEEAIGEFMSHQVDTQYYCPARISLHKLRKSN